MQLRMTLWHVVGTCARPLHEHLTKHSLLLTCLQNVSVTLLLQRSPALHACTSTGSTGVICSRESIIVHQGSRRTVALTAATCDSVKHTALSGFVAECPLIWQLAARAVHALPCRLVAVVGLGGSECQERWQVSQPSGRLWLCCLQAVVSHYLHVSWSATYRDGSVQFSGGLMVRMPW